MEHLVSILWAVSAAIAVKRRGALTVRQSRGMSAQRVFCLGVPFFRSCLDRLRREIIRIEAADRLWAGNRNDSWNLNVSFRQHRPICWVVLERIAARERFQRRVISDTLRTHRMDPRWTLRSLIDRNPLVSMAEVNGSLIDLRDTPREVQAIAYNKGMIPYIPADQK
jgi:hypothetical protein